MLVGDVSVGCVARVKREWISNKKKGKGEGEKWGIIRVREGGGEVDHRVGCGGG